MRSIRLSLVGSFLLLLALALGAVSLLVYRIAEESQRGKQASERELLLERAKDKRQEEATKLDNDLLAQAYYLANQAQMQFSWQRGSNQDYLPLVLLSAALAPNGHITAPLWFCEGNHGTKIGEMLL